MCCPGFSSRPYLVFPSKLAHRLLLLPTEVHAGDEPTVWPKDLLLELWPRQAFFDEPYPAHRLTSTLTAYVQELHHATRRADARPALHG